MDALILKKTISINAELGTVWDALIDPESTKQYMFGCVPVTDWKVGSSLIWKGALDGIEYVIGEIVNFEPHAVLAYTTFAPHSGDEDIADNYLTGEFLLSYVNGETKVEISQGDFNRVANGQKRYHESIAAWETSMRAFKELLENRT